MSTFPSFRTFLVLALLAAPAAAQVPTFALELITGFNAGSALPTTSPGTLGLGLSPLPSGTRTVSGGTLLGVSPSFNLGAFRVVGPATHAWTVTPTALPVTLSNKGGSTLTMVLGSATLAPGGTGVLPEGNDSGPIYVGLTVNVGVASTTPSGSYTGMLELTAQDTTDSGKPVSLLLPIELTVDPTPITLEKHADLAFGKVLAGISAGTVVLAPDGTRTPGGGTLLLPGTFNAASFTVSGAPGALYAIVLPSAPVHLTSGSSTLNAVAFTSTPTTTGALGALGQQALAVGATLLVDANQAAGTYLGTFPVTVMYQ